MYIYIYYIYTYMYLVGVLKRNIHPVNIFYADSAGYSNRITTFGRKSNNNNVEEVASIIVAT